MKRNWNFLKKNALNILIICIFLASASFASYPFISDWINEKHQSVAVSEYEKLAEQKPKEQLDALWQGARAYNAALKRQLYPFDPNEQFHKEYEDTLLTDPSQPMAVLFIESIGLKLPIYHGTDDLTLHEGLGHVEGSSLPTGEKGEHVLISGHSGLANAEMFDHLDQLREGDVFSLEVLDQTFTYQVKEISVIFPEDYRSLPLDSQKDLVTLVTCTPYGVNTQRLLVTGERMDEPAAEEIGEKQSAVPAWSVSKEMIVLGLFILLIFTGVIVWICRQCKKHKI